MSSSNPSDVVLTEIDETLVSWEKLRDYVTWNDQEVDAYLEGKGWNSDDRADFINILRHGKRELTAAELWAYCRSLMKKKGSGNPPPPPWRA
jgi:hypothetical protein